MLFDLRGRGRRRTIQAIYLSLAVLMGGGLVLFGIGGATNGGLFDAFKSNNGGSSASTGFEKQIKAAERRVRVNPKDEAGWALLAKLRYQQAGAGGNYDQARQTFTSKGQAELARAATAWKRYLALEPKKPDPDLATIMARALGPDGLGKLEDAVAAQEIVVESQPPNANLYAQLAILAYSAGQIRKGDLSADKAVSLTPKDQRADFKQQLDQAKSQATGGVTTTG
jgi:cytochrome c-type biogenesis protein CcmH/NrfG